MWERSLTANKATSKPIAVRDRSYKKIAVRDRSYRKSQRMPVWTYFFFFWPGVLGVAGRRLGDSSVPRQLALPHQQGYSALSFLV